MEVDLLLVHPPSIMDFQGKRRGPVSDLTPSTPLFELYPAGFLSLVSYLEGKGFQVKILNAAYRMLVDPSFSLERALKDVRARVYGVSLHWLVHASGALKTARLLKRLHPEGFVLLGGLTSTFFWKVLLERYPFLDGVVLGDTVEDAVESLLNQLSKGRPRLEEVQNLAWRKSGQLKLNQLKEMPENLDKYAIDYRRVVECILRFGLRDGLPFARFLREPIGLALTMKGCPHNCVTCGGSAYAYKNFFLRSRPAFKSPETIAGEILSLLEYARIPVFVVGDLQAGGSRRLEKLANLLSQAKIDSPIIYEFFRPPPEEVLKLLRKTSERVMLQISPESHEEEVRRSFGRNYGNQELLRFVLHAGRLNFERLDLYFMVGLPRQTFDSALETPRFFEALLKEGSTLLNGFIAPLAPFIDPGSLAYMRPEAYGYRLLFKDLESHIRALEAEWWGDMLNYETRWMDRGRIVAAFYRAAGSLLKIKADHGLVDAGEAEKILEALKEPWEGEEARLARETIPSGDLYPSRSLLLALKPRFYRTLTKTLLKRSLNRLRKVKV